MATTFNAMRKALVMIIFLSLKSFTVFSSMDLLIGYLKALPLEMGGGGVRWEGAHAKWGVVANFRVRTMGEEDQIFATFVLTYIVNNPLAEPVEQRVFLKF